MKLRNIVIGLSVLTVLSFVLVQQNTYAHFQASPTPHPTHTATPHPTVKPCDDNWNEKDHNCFESTPTPTATPSASPSPTSEPTESPVESPVPSSTPDVGQASGVELAAGEAQSCQDNGTHVAPTILTFDRRDSLKPTVVNLTWSTTDTTDFVIYYGLANNSVMPWNTGRVSGHSDSIDVMTTDSVNVKVCSVSSCGQELCGAIVDP